MPSTKRIHQKNFSDWQDKQCAKCYMCSNDEETMQCQLFYMPYYTWGEYAQNSKRSCWIKIKKAKRSPKQCWGYCGSMAEYERRGGAI